MERRSGVFCLPKLGSRPTRAQKAAPADMADAGHRHAVARRQFSAEASAVRQCGNGHTLSRRKDTAPANTKPTLVARVPQVLRLRAEE